MAGTYYYRLDMEATRHGWQWKVLRTDSIEDGLQPTDYDFSPGMSATVRRGWSYSRRAVTRRAARAMRRDRAYLARQARNSREVIN